MRSSVKQVILSFIFFMLLTLLLNVPGPHKVAAQQATGSVPTVTGTPWGHYITVTYTDQINVRAGPDQYAYNVIGVLLSGEIAPAVGISPDGTWIQIRYAGVENNLGWVLGAYVKIMPDNILPYILPPPTPTQQATPTINPALVAAFLPAMSPTRIPTYTPPGPLQVPTYTSSSASRASIGPVPMGLIIVLLGLIGGFGAFISFLRGR